MLRGQMPDQDIFFFLKYARENAIIRRKKILILTAHNQRPPLRSYSGIYNHHVDRARREIRVRIGNNSRAIEKVERRNSVRDIHNLHVGIDSQDDALQHAHQVVVRAIIGRQRNDRIRQDSLPLGSQKCSSNAEWRGTPLFRRYPTPPRESRTPAPPGCAFANAYYGCEILSLWLHWSRRAVMIRYS